MNYLARLTLRLITDSGLPIPITEHRIDGNKELLCDFLWIGDNHRVMLSIDEGKNLEGKQKDSLKLKSDIEKLNEASLLGFTVIRVTKAHMISGQMVNWIKRALKL